MQFKQQDCTRKRSLTVSCNTAVYLILVMHKIYATNNSMREIR